MVIYKKLHNVLQSSSETHLIPRRKDNWCAAALFHNLVFPRMGDMLGISLFHLLNETYLLPQIMCLFSLSSRTNCFTGGTFSAVIRKKITNKYKGNSLIFPCTDVSRQNEMAQICCCYERDVDSHSSCASSWELLVIFPW